MELNIFGAFVALPSPSCVTLDRWLNVSELPFFQIVMVISGTRCEKHFTGYQGHRRTSARFYIQYPIPGPFTSSALSSSAACGQ